MLQRYLIVWLSLSSYVAYQWTNWFPGTADAPAFDPFTASKPGLPYLIAVTMFAIGWMLPREEVRMVARRWPTVLSGTALQYATMPLLAWCVGRSFGFEGDMLIGIIMVGCVPGAMASNVLTLLARGNTSYSVSLTTSATLLSPLLVPIVLSLALKTQQAVTINPLQVSCTLFLTVVLPVVTGHLLGRTFPNIERHARVVGSTVANLAILWIIAAVVGMNRDRLASLASNWSETWLLPAALLTINIGGYSAGYAGGVAMRLPEPMRRALTLEVGM